ncbi:hypothetical protein [Micromonospora peucetia]|uniref:Uncharacterized protein n=1 Tax=Micromonospora peucetia TaxID=47871 RepID=A0ABZ1EHJ5_9ACTN|nr:hypothetical protein [Micromonospora peucetia]WSA33146.1 hypothetical protein OIE14_03455 [Micromonospora peucetia]
MVAAVLALCLVGVCGAAVGGVAIFKARSGPQDQSAVRSSPGPMETTGALPQVEPADPPTRIAPTTPAAPPPPPAKIGQCIVVSEKGSFQGIGNCNGTRGTYRVISLDASQGECADPDSAYITEAGYRLCLERHLVRFYCYKFPKDDGWIVGASKCKAKGTVHIIDIVSGATNGNRCTQDRKWNRWYRFTNPTVVYCVMRY